MTTLQELEASIQDTMEAALRCEISEDDATAAIILIQSTIIGLLKQAA